MIKFIEYQKNKYPVRVSYYALKHTTNELKEKDPKNELSIEDVMSGDITTYEPLLYYSLKAGAKATGKTLVIPRDDIEFVLDECFNEFLNIVPLFFQDSGLAGKTPKPKKK